jgi:hypothetical protein
MERARDRGPARPGAQLADPGAGRAARRSGGQERLPAAPELVLQGGNELLALCRRADLEQFRRDGQQEAE